MGQIISWILFICTCVCVCLCVCVSVYTYTQRERERLWHTDWAKCMLQHYVSWEKKQFALSTGEFCRTFVPNTWLQVYRLLFPLFFRLCSMQICSLKGCASCIPFLLLPLLHPFQILSFSYSEYKETDWRSGMNNWLQDNGHAVWGCSVIWKCSFFFNAEFSRIQKWNWVIIHYERQFDFCLLAFFEVASWFFNSQTGDLPMCI